MTQFPMEYFQAELKKPLDYNEYLPTMICYSLKYLETFRRHVLLKNVEDEEIVNYIVKLNYSNVNSEINIYWGLLTPKERNVFVKMHLIINNQWLRMTNNND